MLENGQMVVLNIQDILPNRFQPRIHFDEVKLNELAESIRKYGVIQPIVVRPIGNKYEIIAGERRFKASFLANRTTIPAIIINLSDRDSEELALLENIQRQDLTPIEEAVSYKRILDVGYITQEELAKRLGKSQSAIANKIRLLNLDDHVQDALLHGRISERHARSLLRLHNKNSQIHMLSRIISERLTVKRTDEEINKLLTSPEGGEQKSISPRQEELNKKPPLNKDTSVRRAVPVASHKIIRVNPPKELEEKLKQDKKIERGQGFMDIDKILQEAQDITPKEAPVNDIAELMKQNPSTIVSEPIHTETVQQVQPSLPADNNKFINPGGNIPQPTQAAPTSQAQEMVSFDSIFNQTPANLQPTATPTLNSQPSQYTSGSVSNNQSAPIYPINEENPVVSPNLEVPIKTQVQPPKEIPSVETLNVPQVEQVNRENINYNLNNQVQTPSVAPISNASVPPQRSQGPMSSFANVPDSEILEASAPSAIAASVSPTPAVQTSVPNLHGANNFRQVISLIRNCAAEIEKLGYYVDVDELDLDENYQVTFKINKE